jgi:4-hydroxythreonine-4-phosphate dehydrogenase
LKPPVLAITLGEPAGVGPEVTVGALSSPEVTTCGATFLVFGPQALYDAAAAALEAGGRDPETYRRAVAERRVRFTGLEVSGRAKPGSPAPEDEPAVVESIRGAVRAALDREIGALVTAPLDKRALFHQGYPGWGHTELLAHLTGAPTPTMVLMARPRVSAPPLRVALVTNHVPLKDVPKAFTRELLEARARVLHEGLGALGIARPRLGVAGFNPHCGEGGELGTEDRDLIRPAVEALLREGLDVRGPISADTVFVRAVQGELDAVLAMYHDQGLGPVKLYGFGHGVNWTLGLPIVRTSPDHGTAYDIAGTGRADPSSMVEAILLAAQLASR